MKPRSRRRTYVLVIETCDQCGGEGYVLVDKGDGMTYEEPCPECEASGEVERRKELMTLLQQVLCTSWRAS